MKYIYLLIFSLFLFINNVSASHFAGADLSYTCLGGNTYQITYSFYRDCSGVPEPGSVPMSFDCSSNPAFNFTATLFKIPGTGQEITPGCSALPTRCDGPQYNRYGIREYVYQATITLAPCNSWNMHYHNSARNPISTVSVGGGWYNMATLNNLTAPCNSSPVFSNRPVAVICTNQSFCFNHGALDPDGDSLVYSFYPVMTNSQTASVTYYPPYTYTNFLASVSPPGITIDPVTGDICFTPTLVQSTVFGVKVKEYRTINGTPTLIGTVYRDIQLKIVQCNNSIPILSGMDTTLSHTYNPNDTTYRIDVCLSNDPIQFDINGFDADTFNASNIGHPERFIISWNTGIPTGSFTTHHNGTDSAYAHFSWLPTAADVGNIKCFTATIQDDACPYNGFQTFSYCILVRGMMVDIGTDTLLCEGESYTVTANADTTTVNYLWYLNGNLSTLPQSQDWYHINSLTLGQGSHTLKIETNDGSTTTQCPGIDEIKIEVVYQPVINNMIPDTAFCDGNSVTFDAGQGLQYTWTDIAMNPLGASQTFTTSASGFYIVTVNGGINTRCYDVDTFEVINIPIPNLGPDTCIWQQDLPFVISGSILPGGITYLWEDASTNRFHNITQSNHYSLYYVSNGVMCSDSQIVNVIDKDNVILSAKIQANDNIEIEPFQNGDRTICTHQKLKLKAPIPPVGHSYDYEWFKNSSSVSTSPVYIFKENSENLYIIQLNVGGCINEINVVTEFCEVDVPNIITPNNDGTNDKFRIMLKGTDKEFYHSFPNSTLTIMNRWGNKIYESINYQNTWDGNNAADGVYYWILDLKDGQETVLMGTVTILSK